MKRHTEHPEINDGLQSKRLSEMSKKADVDLGLHDALSRGFLFRLQFDEYPKEHVMQKENEPFMLAHARALLMGVGFNQQESDRQIHEALQELDPPGADPQYASNQILSWCQ
jgi:hypothetical protein